MADKNFRSYRSHDPAMRGGDRYASANGSDDPLAELARLIGQSDPVDEYAPGANAGVPAYEPVPEAASDWSADDRYVPANTPAQQAYPQEDAYPQDDPAGPAFDPRYDGRLDAAQDYRQQHHSDEQYRDEQYDPPPLPPVAREPVYAPPASPAPPQRMNAMREEPRAFPLPPQSRSDRAPPMNGEPLPSFLPQARDDRYQYDEHDREEAEDESYETDTYEDEPPRRRRGLVMVAALLGLAVLGTAGAYAYRTMFGGAMLPSLPPIIKADTSPNKIIPSAASTPGTAQASAANGGSGEKLVSREEKPVDVPAPVNTAPRVISTIPVFPAPESQTPGSMGSAMGSVAPGMTAPVMPTPVAPPPANPAAVSLPTAATAVPAAPVAAPEPKKIHTVAIRPDQMGGNDAPAAAPAPAPPPPPPARVATAPNPPRPAPPVAAPQPAPAPQRASPNAPLSIVPTQGETPAALARPARTAVAQPTAISPASPAPAAAAPSAGGGYAVQVTSQRSEAEAQTAFRALSAKYPAQLGNHQPIIRRADLGEKGVFYRALVGPYASAEQAAGVCSGIKAAGGTCIVQRN